MFYNKIKNYSTHQSILNLIFAFIPLSLMAGNTVVNINIILFLLYGGIIILLKKLSLNFNREKLLLFSFFTVLVISTTVNNHIPTAENYVKLFLYFRFFLLYLFIETLFRNDILKINLFNKIILFSSIFISIDLLIQYFVGVNLLGFSPNGQYHSGIFNEESIAGSYIQNIFIFSILSLVFLIKDNKKFSFYLVIIISLLLIATFISGNRMPMILNLFTVILLFLFVKKLRKEFLSCLLIFFSIGYLFYMNDENINKRYQKFFSKIFTYNSTITIKNAAGPEDEKFKNDISKYYFFTNHSSSRHGFIYKYTFNSFKENKFLGKGYKSSRRYCYDKIPLDQFCLPHPHNYHLEILHDTGIIGYFLCCLFVISILYRITLLMKKEKNFNKKLIYCLLLINLFIILWPLKSTGSIYTTWVATFFWIIVSFTNLKLSGIKKSKLD